MKRYSVTYIGELPPPYGGVAVKNQLVFQNVFQSEDSQFIDLVICKREPWKTPIIFLKIIISMILSESIIIGVGTTQRRKILLKMQRCLAGNRGLKKVILLVMGGQFHIQMAKDRLLQKYIKLIDSIWVETKEMERALKDMGIEQTYYFPNARMDCGSRPPRIIEANDKLRLVYFSRICEEKGVDIIMKAYKIWESKKIPISLDFYGEIAENIKERFCKFICAEKNDIHYHGVFDAVNQDVYAELNQYDIMLLPTHWEGEGVPGALIESKMSGITAIVSKCRELLQ